MGLGAIPGADEGRARRDRLLRAPYRIEQGFDLPAPQAALGDQGVGDPLDCAPDPGLVKDPFDGAEIARACTTWCTPISSDRTQRSPWPGCAIAADPVGAGRSGLAGRQRPILPRAGPGKLRMHDATLTRHELR